MAEIRLFLLSSIENDLKINQFFPYGFNNQESISELLSISNYFKKCGDGCLKTKDFIYYYKTYVPLSKSDSPFFLLFYCTNSYNEKNIDNLCEEIFKILDDDPTEETRLKNTSKTEINKIFIEYRHLQGDIIKNTSEKDKEKEIITMNKSLNDSSYNKSYLSNNNSVDKRGDPRFYSYFNRNRSRGSFDNDNDSYFFSDSNSFKKTKYEETRLGVDKRFTEYITNENFEKWKKVKKNYLIFSLFLSIITYFLFPLVLRFLFN